MRQRLPAAFKRATIFATGAVLAVPLSWAVAPADINRGVLDAGVPEKLERVVIEGNATRAMGHSLFLDVGVFRTAPGIPSNPGSGKVAPAKDENNSNKDDCNNPTTNNPVVIATGEKFKTELDFIAGGLYGISLERTYRSVNAMGFMFGPKWLSSLEYRPLMISYEGCTYDPDWGCVATAVTVEQTNGTSTIYRRTESPRDSRRLQLLRRWSYEQVEQVLT